MRPLTGLARKGTPRLFETQDSQARWPVAGQGVVAQLRAHPGRIALVVGENSDVTEALGAFADLLGVVPVHVSREFAHDLPETAADIITRLSSRPVLVELDILFWKPWLPLDPIRILHQIARRGTPVIAAWPGKIGGTQMTYSEPGRVDYYSSSLPEGVVLRSRSRRYPDEVPYKAEWISG